MTDDFNEAPTVTTARPAAAALLAEHVEENLRLHARVNELEAKLAAVRKVQAHYSTERGYCVALADLNDALGEPGRLPEASGR